MNNSNLFRLPIAALLIWLILIAALWWGINKQELTSQKKIIAEETEKASQLILLDMDHRFKALRRIAKRWEIRGSTPEVEFLSDVSAYTTDDPGYQAIEWVDKNFVVRWLAPLTGNESSKNLDLKFEENRRKTLEIAMEKRAFLMTRPIDLVQGGKGFLMVFPLYPGDEFDGFVVAVIRAETWLSNLFQLETNRSQLDYILPLISIDGVRVYKADGWDTQATSPLDKSNYASFLDHGISVSARPSPVFLNARYTFYNQLMFTLLMLLSLPFLGMAYLYIKATSSARDAVEGKNLLEKEVAERKQAEEDLALYRLMVESTSDPMFLIESETGRMAYVNEPAIRHFGTPIDEILTWRIPDWDPNFTDADMAGHVEAIRHTPGMIIETVHRVNGGELVPVEVSLNLTEYKGKLYHFGFFHNISDRLAAQKALEEANRMLSTVINTIPVRVFWKDKDLKYLGCNRLFVEDAGYSSFEEIIGKSEDDMPWNKEDGEHISEDKLVMNSGEELVGYEESQTAPDGRVIWLETSKVPLRDGEGNIYGILGTYHEITGRKEAEQELHRIMGELARKTEDLEEANEQLSQYAYVVSHDLKTPLRAIHNYADFLREDLEDSLDGDQKEYLEGLGKAVRQSQKLVDDLLDLSRIGKNAGDAQRIDAGNFLLTMINSFDLQSDVEVEIASYMPCVMADPVLLRQIFQNLVTNAVKFNSSVRKVVEIGWLPREENYVDVFVRDNGIGIDERYHDKIFGVFQRLHASHEFEGTGIGLAIVKKAAEKIHASVRLESEAGKGSTFFVSLPLAKDAEGGSP